MRPQKKKKNGRWIFLWSVLIIFGVISVFSGEKAFLIIKMFGRLLLQIMPVFALIYLLIVLLNYFIDDKALKKHLGENSGVKGWLITIGAGIISVGPVYMWYPLLKELQKGGVSHKYIASFLYNRGIKLQWLPMLIFYFGLRYSVILLLVMAAFSIPQGLITEKLIRGKMGHYL